MHIRASVLVLAISAPLILVAAAYLQWGLVGLPVVSVAASSALGPHGFPAWLRVAHYVNFLFLTLLIRSGLSILMDHPRLYGSVHCTPGTEWLRLTPLGIPTDPAWTAKDDSRYLSPWIGLPGRRHTVGMARHWHFLSVLFWIGNGVVFVVLLFASGQWARLVPTSWQIVPDAWAVFVHYATFHMPPEPDTLHHFNALQQLGYFGVVFVLAPLAIVTGPSMSPGLTSAVRAYPKLPGNRQIGRSLHFLVMIAFVMFLIVHVSMVAMTGLTRNMSHIVLGTSDARPYALYLGLGGIALVVLVNAWAHWAAWRRPRTVQHVAKALVSPVMSALLGRAPSVATFGPADISPYFWRNGRLPTSDVWTGLVARDFADYRLRVHGLVETPLSLSIEELRALGCTRQITLHHCIQGWSGIAEWGGLPLATLLAHARPKPNAKAVVFTSFGDGAALNDAAVSGRYYDSLPMSDAQNPQTLLAYEMNGAALPVPHGAPLRLRVENQLGFKMVKWIESIELVEDIARVQKGEGGFAEDNEYFGERANI